jgi:CelD/BcsL family acetyltransferase involved in cellulose biosynthesis
MIQPNLITREEDFLDLEREWKDLLPRTAADNIFLTWEWVSTWWEVFGESKQPHILTFRDNNKLVGILPCYMWSRPLLRLGKIRELRFIGTGETVRSEYLDLICLPDRRKECLEKLAELILRDRDWDIAVFRDLLENSVLGKFFPGRFKDCETINREPCYFVEIPPDFETYLKGIDSRTRRNIRNRRRNLERDFRLEYHRLRPDESLEEWMAEFKRLHAARLEQRGLPSKFSDPRYSRFHEKIARAFQSSGQLFAADLQLDGQMVAGRYNFLYNGTVYDYQTGYNPEFGRQGVMQALISYMIEDCSADQIGKFDFLAGDEDYKRHFANAESEISSRRIVNRTFRGRFYRLARRLKPGR